MARDITVGIDVGTHQIKVLVAEKTTEKERDFPRIIGIGQTESKGLRHGYIVNDSDVRGSIEKAVSEAEKSSGLKIRRAFLSVGGVGLESLVSTGSAIVSRSDNEITKLDLDKARESSRLSISGSQIVNRKIIHAIPLRYRIDRKDVLSNRPIGMRGVKLEVDVLFITTLEQQLNDLISATEQAGVEVEDVMASPIAASLVSLSKIQKVAGSILANIGAETVSIVVYEKNLPISLEVFPIGSTDITNDIALGLRVSLEEAERIKLGAVTSANYSKKRLDEIVAARLSDIFELIEAHLKKINRHGLLPGGIVITGGGSGLHTIEDLAKAALKIPSKSFSFVTPTGSKYQIKDGTWSVAYGLAIWGFTGDTEGSTGGDIGTLTKKLVKAIANSIKPLLP